MASGNWSSPIPLGDYNKAPNAPGVYEIGFYRKPRGKNLDLRPRFNPYYIGRAQGPNTTIRSRLRVHATGYGSLDVQAYLTGGQRSHLYCRWKQVDNPKGAEAQLLQNNPCKYPWNRRNENE